MTMNHTFSLLFYIKKDLRYTLEKASIFFRITVDGKRSEQSIQRMIEIDRWDSKAGRVKGNKADAKVINDYIDTIRVKVNKIHSRLEESNTVITAAKIRDKYNGVDEKRKSIKEVFEYHNLMVKQTIGKDFALGTFKRYETTLKHVQDFIKYQYKVDDMILDEIKYKFITDFEFYLKTVRACNHNSTLKYIRNFRKIVNLAIANEWMDKDPFLKFKVKLKEVKREHLNQEELAELEQRQLPVGRLDQVRDVFVFCCYTGLSYVDVEKLTPKDISRGLDGEYWIFTERTKTGNSSNIPLLPKALELVAKYQDEPENVNNGKLLPVISNQKLNAYLKELATICGIDKNITFHMARHTFATTVTLTNGVSIETVSSMLGHKNIRTTQIYAKVVQRKVSDDMLKLKSILSSDNQKAVNQ
jgi:site-specific recombinase XerD